MNLTGSLLDNIEKESIYDLITGEAVIDSCIQEIEGVHIIPGDVRMRNLDKAMDEEIFKEVRIKNALNSLNELYDYALIDCRPDMRLAETNAIIASDALVVPIEAHVYSLDGLDLLTAFKEKVERQLNKEIPLKAFYTRVGQGNSPKDTMKYGKENYENILESYIRSNVKLQEASTERKFIHDFASRSNGAKDYSNLVEELRDNGIV